MIDRDAEETRLILCDHSGSADSFNNLLDLTFLPRDVIERWMSAKNLEEITFAIEEALGAYLKLSPWQLNDVRLEMPRAVLQILHTAANNTDVTILTTCFRFLTHIFELHSLIYSTCVDIVLAKTLKFIDDKRPPLQCATLRCLGVFFTNMPFRCLEGYLPTILGTARENEAGDVEEELDSRSENRLKLVTISILSFNREIVTGISILTPEHELSLANLTRNVVCGIFDIDTTVDGGDYGKSFFSERRISTGNYTVQQRVISAAIDLVAASALILCHAHAPLVRSELSIGRDAMSSSSSCHMDPTPELFPPKFIVNVLTDGNHELRVGQPVQEETVKRMTEKRLPSLSVDSDLADTANLLLIYAGTRDPILSLPPPILGPLVLCIPLFEPSDSLATTAESSSNLSGKMLTSNGTVLSPPRRFSSSNSNIPSSQYGFLEDGNGSMSLDGIDSDIDRSKLSALKKSQSRGGSRSQRRGCMSQPSLPSCMSPDVPVFFVVNRSEGADSVGSRSPASGSARSIFFSKKAVSNDDFEVNEAFPVHRKSRSAKCDVFRDSASSPSPYENFHRSNRLIGTLKEGDADADFGNCDDSENGKFDLDSEPVPDAIAYEDVDTDGGTRSCASANNSRSISRNGDMSADMLALVRESFPHDRLNRTADGHSRANGQGHNNYTLDRFDVLDGSSHAQTHLGAVSHDSSGIRIQGLSHSNSSQGRLGKRSIDIAMSLAKDSKQLLASASLPGPFLSLDGLEHSLVKQGGPLFALPSPASSLKFSTDLDRSGRLQLSCDSIWDTNPSITLGPIGGHGLVKKLRTLRSPCSDLRSDSGFFASSPLSSNPISPISLGSLTSSKADAMLKSRDSGRFQREQEVKPRKGSVPETASSVQRDYQLAGETFEYLSTEAIEPCSAPQRDFMKAIQGIGSHEWPEIFHTLTTVRRLSLHHSSFLTSSSSTSSSGSLASGSIAGGALHSIVLGVLKQVDNLRSAVAKNALLTLGDLFQGLGRYMDLEVALSLTHVLKRFADSSTFLVESAERALLQMMENVSAAKSLSGLLTAAEHRASTVRGKVASVLYLLWHQKLKELKATCFPGGKDQEMLKTKISKLVSDQSPEARTASRNIVRFLVLEGVVSKSEWSLCIPPAQLDKILSQPMTPPALIESSSGRGGQRKSRVSLTSTSPLYTRHMSIQVPEETSVKSKVNGGYKNRHSLGCLTTAPFLPAPSPCPSTSASPPMTDSASNIEPADKDHRHDKGVRKADRGVSFAADDSSECTAQTVHSQGRRSMNAGTRPVGKAGFGSDWTTGIAGLSHSKSKDPARSSSFLNPDIPELQCLPDLVHAASSSTHWTERQESIKSIATLVNVHWKALIDEGKMAPVVESVLERLEDGSVKVAVCALTCLQSIHESTPKALGHSTATQLAVITSLHNAASASNRLIATNAMNFLVLFVSSVPVHLTVSHVCAISLHEKERQRAVAFRVLVDMLTVHVHPQREELFSGGFIRRYIFPTICQVLFGAASKGEVRVAAAETLRALQQVMLSTSTSSFDKKKEHVTSEKFRDKESEKTRDRYNSKLYIEKVKDNDCENKILWTWCRDTAHQEEIRRLTANSV